MVHGDPEPLTRIADRVDDLAAKMQALADHVRWIEEQIDPVFRIVPEPHITALRWIEAVTGLSQERIGALLSVSRQTIRNWTDGSPIAPHNRQRIFAVRDVLERASIRYPTQSELGSWIDSPQGSDGRTPAQLIEAGRIDEARYWAVANVRFKVNPLKIRGASVPTLYRRAGYQDEDEELLRLYGAPGGEDEDEDE